MKVSGGNRLHTGIGVGIRALLVVCLSIAILASRDAAAENVSGQAIYTTDLLRNAHGGLDTGSAQLQNIDLKFDIGLGQRGALHAYLLWNDDATFSDRYTGDAQGVSNIEARRATRLYELWYEHAISDAWNLRVGLYDLNSEFDAIETAGLFINSSHGIGAEYAQTGQNGPSIFPVTSFAARLHWKISDNSVVRVALLDAVPGDLNDPSATRVDIDQTEGLLQAIEFNHVLPSELRLGLGAYRYTESFERINGIDLKGQALRDDNNSGLYVFAEQSLFDDPTSNLSARGFLRFGVANDELNPLARYFGSGIVLRGINPRRRQDELGLAVASVRTGRDFRTLTGADKTEMTFELSYSAQLYDWLRVQPDIQYVINPGTDPQLANALVFGIRLQISKDFSGNYVGAASGKL